MTDKNKDAKKIAELKEKLSKVKEQKSAEARKLRKELKRTQRRAAIGAWSALPAEERLKKHQKQLEIVGKLLGDLTKGAKKVQGNPYVHSLRKKTKSLNKRIKKINRLLEKKKSASGATDAAPAGS